MRKTRFAAAAGRRFTLLGVLPLLLLGIVCAAQMFDVGRRAIDTRNQLVAEAVRLDIEGYMREHVHVALQLRGITDDEEIQTVMDSATSNLPTLESIMLVDTNGAVRLASVNPEMGARRADLIGIDQSRNPECIAAWNSGATSWSGVFTSALSGDRAMSVAVPVGNSLALLTIDIEDLSSRVRPSPTEPNALSMIIDRNGTLLFHSATEVAALRQNLSTLTPVAAALNGDEGDYQYQRDGESMLASTKQVVGPDWIVMVEQDWRDARLPIISLLWWIAGAVVLTAGLATMAAVLFSRDLAAPISHLQRYTETVRDGEYGAEIGVYRHQELAELAESVQTMAIAVRARELDLATARVSLEESNKTLLNVVYSTTQAMGKIVGGRDPYTQGHQIRVAQLAGDLAREMGVSDYDVEGIELAALVHDIGKLAVPSEILVKPGKISDIEYQLIQQHPQWGYDILQEIPFDWPVAQIVLQHHERLDGKGYPQGLSGDEVCLGARVIAVADVVEAMASHRPYRPSLGLDAALAEVASRPEAFDSQVVAALNALAESGRLTLSDWHE